MDDFISREDTIEKMQEVAWYHQNKNGEMVHGANPAEHQAWYKAKDVYKVLEDMPPAQPEPKKGEWILMSDADGEYYACSECGEELPYCSETPTWDNPYSRKQSIDKTDFCPNCGADMRGLE